MNKINNSIKDYNTSALKRNMVGTTLKLAGWVQEKRDLGKIIFLIIKDSYGTIQLIAEKITDEKVYNLLASLTKGSAVAVEGVLQYKKILSKNDISILKEENVLDDETCKPDLFELVVKKVHFFNNSNPLPVDIYNLGKEIALNYRFLELRKGILLENLKFRAKVLSCIRNILERESFLEVETPILTSPTPEGARDYLVPSRLHIGRCYALPQSPQIFKQLLVIGSVEKYYQLARCFRDEDLRHDRQPEFTQLDLETSFLTSIDIRNILEKILKELWFKTIGVQLGDFQTITYDEAMNSYGSDKPDLRWKEKIVNLKDIDKKNRTLLEWFNNYRDNENTFIFSLKVPNIFEKVNINKFTEEYTKNNTNSILWIYKDNLDKIVCSIDIPKEIIDYILEITLKNKFELNDNIICIVFGEDKTDLLIKLGELRTSIIEKMNFDKKLFEVTWVVDFPMFEKEKSTGKLTPMHHPFTMPKGFNGSIEELGAEDSWIADSYDIVVNGYELGGGSIRIHDKKLQNHIFDIIGLDREIKQERFGFFIDALGYGAPIHGGIALGIDRLIMLLLGINRIRDVIAFPKSTSASCLLTGAPQVPLLESLEELHLSFNNKK